MTVNFKSRQENYTSSAGVGPWIQMRTEVLLGRFFFRYAIFCLQYVFPLQFVDVFNFCE